MINPKMKYSEILNKSFWVAAAIFVSTPFVWLALNNMAASDDYYDYYLLQRFGPFEAVYHYYLNWSGRFVSHFLAFCLNPLQLGERIGPAITGLTGICMLWFTAFQVSKVIQRVYYVSLNSWSMGVILGAFWLCYLPYPSEIIYWFTGMIAYQPGLAMIAFWSVLHFKKDKSKFLQIIYFVLPFLIGGTNEVNVFIMSFVLALLFPIENPKSKQFWIAIGIFMLSASLELLAPGSRYRMEYFTETAGNPVANLSFAIQHSFSAMWFIIRDWSRSTPLFLVAFIIGIGIKIHPELKIHPIKLLFAFLGILIVPLMYFPFFYGTGMTSPPGRLHDVVFLFFTTWTIGITPIVLNKLKIEIPKPILIQGIFSLILIWQASYSSRFRGAISDVKILPQFRNELNERADKTTLHKRTIPHKQLVLNPITKIPYTMFFGDLTNDPKHWYNEGYARYHKIYKVVILEDSVKAK
jgi:hypothetical protein